MRLELAAIGASDLFDFCVVGSGPAGITCALNLASGGKRVVLLEGGDREYSARSQDLYKGEVVGDPLSPLDESRLRYFGGTSNHWGGQCRPLDREDFEAKAANPMTAWPIARSDLDPYLESASAILEIPAVRPDAPLGDSGLKQIQFVSSPLVRFGAKYEARILAHQSLFLVLGANVMHFETDGAAIRGAIVRDYAGLSRIVVAGAYVLAAGGIENSRHLLWSNVQTGGRTVPNPSTLGRYWMPHLTFKVGAVTRANSRVLPFEKNGIAFAPTAATMRDDNILNCGLGFERQPFEGRNPRVPGIVRVALRHGERALRRLGRSVGPGPSLRAAWECEPVAANRVELGRERDTLGIPRTVLHWGRTALDHRTLQACARRFGDWVARTGVGPLRFDPFVFGDAEYPVDLKLMGTHHLGGTRMGASAADGVVDRDCKVFGQRNLFIAGSSVFPSGGHANPTLTIVQLALRLSAHLGALSAL